MLEASELGVFFLLKPCLLIDFHGMYKSLIYLSNDVLVSIPFLVFKTGIFCIFENFWPIAKIELANISLFI